MADSRDEVSLPFRGAVASYIIEKHQGQKYAGKRFPWHYAAHSVAVALRLVDPYEQMVALLHDVLEDTKAARWEVARNFGEELAADVSMLTRRTWEAETYRGYIVRLASHPVPRRVKQADLRENLLCCKRPDAPEVATSLVARYEWALEYLEGQERGREMTESSKKKEVYQYTLLLKGGESPTHMVHCGTLIKTGRSSLLDGAFLQVYYDDELRAEYRSSQVIGYSVKTDHLVFLRGGDEVPDGGGDAE